MKKLILFLLLLASPAWAGGVISGAVMSGCATGTGAAAGPSCTLGSGDSSLVDYVESGSTLSAVSITCTKWEIATTTIITKYVMRLNALTAGGVRTCLLPDDDGSKPSGTTCIADTDVYLAYGDIGGSIVDKSFELPTAKSMSAGTYWICTLEEGDVARGQVYHSLGGGTCAYYDTSWHTAAENVYDMQVYGCQ
jgi:hypothetical protein